MSKTFKSSYMSDGSQLEIESSIASNSFHITHCTAVSEKSFNFRNSDAPALALAILEASGVEAKSIPSARIGTSEHLSDTAYELSTYVEKQQRATAEAKDKAELEAESLALLNASLASCDLGQIELFDALNPIEQQRWLAVARRARALAKEGK